MDAIEYFKGMRKILCEEYLKGIPKDSVGYQATLREMSFYDAAIKALEQQPCEDAVILPPATPQQKTGRWRHYEGMLICSKCGAEFYDDIMEYCGDDVPKCCPDCGEKMEVEE